MAWSQEVRDAIGEAPDIAERVAALREDLEGPAREQDRKRAELAQLEAKLVAQAAAEALDVAKQEVIAHKREIGGLTQAYTDDAKAATAAFVAAAEVLTRWHDRYHRIAAKRERVRHLVLDHGLPDPKLQRLEPPVGANELVLSLLRLVQTFHPFKPGPSPKQQMAATAQAQADAARDAQRAAEVAAQDHSGVARQQQRMTELAMQGVPIASQ